MCQVLNQADTGLTQSDEEKPHVHHVFYFYHFLFNICYVTKSNKHHLFTTKTTLTSTVSYQ